MSSTPENQRFSRLLAYLEQDPENGRLLEDTAEAAFAAGQLDEASSLLARADASKSLSSDGRNLLSLIAIAQQRYDDAIDHLAPLHADSPDDPSLCFNLAWAHAMRGDHGRAADLLDAPVVSAIPRAAALKVQMLHHLQCYDEALALGEALIAANADAPGLAGALAILALDMERPDLARRYAEAAPSEGQALTALGMLELGGHASEAAKQLFDDSLARDPRSPRAWIGKGLALMAEQNAKAALPALDRGAALFQDHIGSWVAAGWACFLTGDEVGARERFGRALDIDPNFAETHGALAVLDIAQGQEDEGRRKADTALRLDPRAFGGQLAKLLLLERSGNHGEAERIRARAFALPVGVNGETLSDALAGLARRRT